MRIKAVSVKNFKCLGPDEVKFDWDDIVVLVGENNVGKTSLLQAIYLFLHENSKTIPSKYFRDIEKAAEGAEIPPAEITIHFTDLSEDDKSQQGVRTRLTSAGDWILKKSYEYAGGEKSETVKYFTYHKSRTASGISDDSTWKKVKERFADLEITEGKTPNAKVAASLDELMDEIEAKHSSDVVVSETETWVSNPGGLQSNVDKFILDNAQYVFVRAVHNASDESEGNKSAFTELFNLLVKKGIQDSPQMENFHQALRDVVALYRKDENGMRPLQAISDIETALSEKVSRIISGKTLIDTDDLDENKISNSVLPTPLIQIDDGYPTTVEDQGNGMQRGLILGLLQLLAEKKSIGLDSKGPQNVLLIEEPELYMHPQMERKMKDTLYKIARQEGFQVIATTHSPIFLDTAEKHRSIVILEKETETRGVKANQVLSEIFEGATLQDQKDRLRMVLNFDPTVNEIFFAKRIVLVEGDSEIAALTNSASLLGVPLDKVRDTAIINCRGKKTIPAFMRVLNHFGKRYFVLHDKDGDDSFNQTIATLAAENGMGTVKMIENTLEDVLLIPADERNGKDKPIKALRKIQALHVAGTLDAALRPYVEFVFGN